jgi:hypothetical protein
MTTTPEASVGDDEILYRRVKAGRDHYINRDGAVHVTPLAFYHRSFAISVNRAVRAWHHEIEAVTFRGEVISSPLLGNPVHADIRLETVSKP